MNKRDMLVWWTNQADCEAIEYACDGLDERFPEYLRSQYSSRYGRCGRGRLWVDEMFGDVRLNPWPVSPLGELLGENPRLGQTYAGIVIRKKDAALLADMPGVITTLKLKRP